MSRSSQPHPDPITFDSILADIKQVKYLRCRLLGKAISDCWDAHVI